MPATSKSQQRLMGWALACKRGEQKDCPPNVQKLADDMTEADLEKYAKTSHENLPDHVEEAVVEAAIYELYKVNEGAIKHLLMLAAEAADFEAFKADANEWMASQGNEPLADDYLQDVYSNAESWSEKMNEGESKEEIETSIRNIEDKLKWINSKRQNSIHPFDPQKKMSDYRVQYEENLRRYREKLANLSESNTFNADAQTMTKTEKLPGQGDSIPPPPGGMTKGDSIKDALTPSLYKAPMGKKSKLNQRVMDWDQFLKAINYKTHDDITQRGHGQNLQNNGSE